MLGAEHQRAGADEPLHHEPAAHIRDAARLESTIVSNMWVMAYTPVEARRTAAAMR